MSFDTFFLKANKYRNIGRLLVYLADRFKAGGLVFWLILTLSEPACFDFSSTERICSHFGAFLIEGMVVEVMGDIQKRLEDGTWETPVNLRSHRQIVACDGMDIPVLSLEYEADAYRKLGRLERAEM
jgi:hypothetical protein